MRNCDTSSTPPLRFACDAMCGGLTRWLRAYGYDSFYREGIEDGELVEIALQESRVLVSSDGPLFDRRLVRDGEVRSCRLPRGKKLLDQFAFVVRAFRLKPREARCSLCNGELHVVSREAVADRVPAGSLLSATRFHQCGQCEKAYWDGTHWRRIDSVRRRMSRMVEALEENAKGDV